MAIKNLKGDLAGRRLDFGSQQSPSIPKRSASIRCATSCAWCNCRRATATPIWCSSTASTYEAPRLKALLDNRGVLKIFHFARFDVAALKHYLGVETGPLYCTKIASKLTRTYTDRHGLKDLVKELLGIELNKQQQSSDWGAHVLSDSQKQYAAQDVLYLHELKARLDQMLEREGRKATGPLLFRFRAGAGRARSRWAGPKKMSSRTDAVHRGAAQARAARRGARPPGALCVGRLRVLIVARCRHLSLPGRHVRRRRPSRRRAPDRCPPTR